MTFKEQYKIFSHNHPWRKWLLIVFLFIILLLALIRISLPFTINYSAISWLKSQGVTANIGDIDISLVDGTFFITNISGKNKNDKGFSVDQNIHLSGNIPNTLLRAKGVRGYFRNKIACISNVY